MSHLGVIHNDSMHNYLLIAYYTPGTGVGAGDAVMRKIELALAPEELTSQCRY